MSQIFDVFIQIFSVLGHLTLEYTVRSRSSEEHNEAGPHRVAQTSYGRLATRRPFASTTIGRWRTPLGLLPEPQGLTYSGSGETGDSFNLIHQCPPERGSPGPFVTQANALRGRPLKPPRSHERAVRLGITSILEPGSHTRATEAGH